MSSYLRFFELERSPFEGGGRSQVVLGTRALREAFGAIQSGLDDGDSRICVGGARGMGKTSLARALPKLLGDAARVAVVPDPTLPWESARPAIARQWSITEGGLARGALVDARTERPLVLVIDRAEKASEDFLDHLDVLLCYRTDNDEPVVQSVLMANLSTSDDDGATSPCPLVWWLDRIQTLQLEFAPLPREGVAPYIEKHLKRAGWRGPALFDADAALAIHEYTGGVPGEISDLCERLLIEAADRGATAVDAGLVRELCEPEPLSTAAVDVRDEDEDVEAPEVDRDATADTREEPVDADDDASDAACDEADDDASFEAGAESVEASFEASEEAVDTSDAALDAAVAAFALDDVADDGEAEPVVADAVNLHEVDETVAAETPSPPTSAIDLEAALEFFEGTGVSNDVAESDGETEREDDDEQPVADTMEMDSAEIPLDDAIDDASLDGAATMDAAVADSAEPLDAAMLLAPPSEAELRALQGGPLHRFARPLVGAIAAVLIGGVALIAFRGDDTADGPSVATTRPATSATEDSVALDPSPGTNPTTTANAPVADDEGPALFAPAGGFVQIEAPPSADATPNDVTRPPTADGSTATTELATSRDATTPSEATRAKKRVLADATPRAEAPASSPASQAPAPAAPAPTATPLPASPAPVPLTAPGGRTPSPSDAPSEGSPGENDESRVDADREAAERVENGAGVTRETPEIASEVDRAAFDAFGIAARPTDAASASSSPSGTDDR